MKKPTQTIVLLNGLSRTTAHWLGFEKLLEPFFNVVALDLPGAGSSVEDSSWSMTIEDMAKHVMQKLDQLGIQRAHFFGVSLGGMVAIACGFRYPERCETLTLVNSSISLPRGPVRRLSTQASLWLLKTMILRPAPPIISAQVARLTLGSDCTSERRRSIVQQLSLQKKPDARGVLKQLMAALRFRPAKHLAKLEVPTLVVRGLDDRFVPPRNSELIAKMIPNAHLVSLEKGGHELMYDMAETLLQTLTDWINASKGRDYEVAR